MSDAKLVLLGTKGGPRMAKGSDWPTSMVLDVGGRPYIIDAGLGVTRQFVEAGYSLGDVHTILITHHHSDHILELGPLLHTVWTSSPMREIEVYGPEPLEASVELFFQSVAFDVRIRMEDEKQADPRGMFNCHEFKEGPVFEDDRVRVTALWVPHPPVHECYALKFETEDRTVVFSADTAYHPPLAAFAKDADLLVHEVMHREGAKRMCERVKGVKPNLWEHMVAGHTFGEDVGRIATEAGVKHLVLNHYTPFDDPAVGHAEFQAIVRETWAGRLTAGRDLMELEI